jgi:hypothetical protein
VRNPDDQVSNSRAARVSTIYYKGWHWAQGWTSRNVPGIDEPRCYHGDRCAHPSTPTCGWYNPGETARWWLDGWGQSPKIVTCHSVPEPQRL